MSHIDLRYQRKEGVVHWQAVVEMVDIFTEGAQICSKHVSMSSLNSFLMSGWIAQESNCRSMRSIVGLTAIFVYMALTSKEISLAVRENLESLRIIASLPESLTL